VKSTETAASEKQLVELVPEEALLPALSQSAHPVEWVEANPPQDADES
jgi:hypothetical protein